MPSEADPTAGKKGEAGFVLETSRTMELFLAIVRVPSAKLANNLNSSLCFWSLLFIIYFLSAPALIPQVKSWPRRIRQDCPSVGIRFPKDLNARSPSWR